MFTLRTLQGKKTLKKVSFIINFFPFLLSEVVPNISGVGRQKGATNFNLSNYSTIIYLHTLLDDTVVDGVGVIVLRENDVIVV